MQNATIEYEFDCDEATLWHIALFDDVYSRRLYLETLQFPRWKVLEQTITDERLTRRVDIHPKVDAVPAAIKKVLGDQLGYIEEGKFDRKTRLYEYRMIPAALPDKSHIDGSMYTKPRGPNGCVRFVDLRVDVNVMLIGRLVEQKIIEDTRATHVHIAAFTRAYLKERAEAAGQ